MTTDELVIEYLDLIADCLVALAWKASPDAGLRLGRLIELRDPQKPELDAILRRVNRPSPQPSESR